MTGFNAVIGSWKIIAMREPRRRRRRAALASVSASPSSRISPPASSSVFGSSPMIAWAITVLPEPDSPTRQSRSPRSTLKDTPFTACGRSAPGGSRTVRPLTSSVLIEHLASHARLRHLRIERVAQAIAQHVDRQHRDGEEHAGEEDVMRIGDELHAPLGHDVAPGRNVGRQADAEEREDRLEQNGKGADVGALHKK